MKPLTRKEMLLNAAANGTLDNFEPATREEVFTKEAFANAGGGVTSWNDLTDKPFGEEVVQTTIKLPTDTEAYTETVSIYGGTYYKISDEIYTVEDVLNGTFQTSPLAPALDIELSSLYSEDGAYVSDYDEYPAIFGLNYPPQMLFVGAEGGTDGLSVGVYTNNLSMIVEFLKNITETTPLPTKYLPEGVSMDGHTHPFSEVTDLPEHLQFGEEKGVFLAEMTVSSLNDTVTPLSESVLADFDYTNLDTVYTLSCNGKTITSKMNVGTDVYGKTVYYIGNPNGAADGVDDNGESLQLAFHNTFLYCKSFDDEYPYTMSLSIADKITPLDPKYLPDEVGGSGFNLIFDDDIVFDTKISDEVSGYMASEAVNINLIFGKVYLVTYQNVGNLFDYNMKMCIGTNNGYDGVGIGAYSYQDLSNSNVFHFTNNNAYYFSQDTVHFKIYEMA